MLQVKPLDIDDILKIETGGQVRRHVEYMTSVMDRETLKSSESNGLTAFWNGEPIGCAGLIQMWDGRATAWSIIGEKASGVRKMMAITRTVRSYLDVAIKNRFHRIEMTVRVDHQEGCHWAKILGFQFEALMKQYDPWRKDHILYARTR